MCQYIAKKLEISTTAVSKQIKLLENELGATLLVRSPRHVSVTETGHHFHDKFKQLVEQIDDIKQFAGTLQHKLQGHLRIYGCAGLSNYFVAPHLAAFMALNPLLTIEMHNNDYVPDFCKEEIDIFVGVMNEEISLQQNELVAAPLIEYRLIYCASPAYLAQHGEPKSLEVNNHCYITHIARPNDMPFDQNQEVFFTPKHLIKVNSNYSALHAALNGVGIAKIPDFMAYDYLQQKRLKHIIIGQTPKKSNAYLFYKKQRYPERKIIAFKKFIQERNAARILQEQA